MEGRGSFALAQNLMNKGHTQLAYDMLRKHYEKATWKDEGAEWQIEVLMTLAKLSSHTGQKGKCSIPYIDEALVLAKDLEKELRQAYEDKLHGIREEYIGMK